MSDENIQTLILISLVSACVGMVVFYERKLYLLKRSKGGSGIVEYVNGFIWGMGTAIILFFILAALWLRGA